jgi:ammonia channel protein AmtB
VCDTIGILNSPKIKIDLFAVDDPLDAVAVHFGGGFWGVISAALFSHGGIVYGANKQSALVTLRTFSAFVSFSFSLLH